MKRKKLINRMIVSALAASMAIMSGTAAMAAETTSPAQAAAAALAGSTTTETANDGSGQNVADDTVQEEEAPAFPGEEWYDQRDVFQVNREDAHTIFKSYDSVLQEHVKKIHRLIMSL